MDDINKTEQTEDRESIIKTIYKLVLGREPSSREISYYKYSTLKDGEIVKKLLDSEEHETTISNGTKYSNLIQESKKLKYSAIKVKSLLEDKEKEIEELKKLLTEKNNTIRELRTNKSEPYLTNTKILEESNKTVYTNSYTAKHTEEESLLDRLLNLLFGK